MAVNRYYSSTAIETTLSAPITDSATSITVVSVAGFPATRPYTLSIDAENASKELITVTNAAGTTLTVTRGVDGTSGVAHTLGAVVRHDHSARDFREPQEHIAATSDVHGVSGVLIGADDLEIVSDALAAHIADAADAHDASAISFTPAGSIAATDVQAAIVEARADAVALDAVVQANLDAHLADTADAHDASAISFSPVGTTAATDVQAAIAEVASEAANLAVTAWVAPTLTNSWVNIGGAFSTAGYRKNGDVVELRGTVQNGTVASIFTLPVGFRPPTTMTFSGLASGAGGVGLALVAISTSGTIIPTYLNDEAYSGITPGDNSVLVLDGITFSVTA